MPIHVEIAATAKNVFPQEPVRVGIGDRLLRNLREIAVLASNVDVPSGRSNCQSGNDHALDHGMRVVFENEPILASARLALISIAKNVFRLWRLLGHERPLQTRVESCPTAPAKPGSLHQVHNLIRLHGESFLDRFVAIKLEIAVEIGRTLPEAAGDDLYFIGMGNERCHL